MDDKFQSFLNDPEKMKAAFAAASQIVNANKGQDEEPTPPPNISPDDFSGILKNMQESGALQGILSALGKNGKPQEAQPQGEEADINQPPQEGASSALGGIGAMLPQLLQMVGGGDSVSGDKSNLLKAMKPYMADVRTGHVDRAVNMANMVKNAKSALGGFKK